MTWEQLKNEIITLGFEDKDDVAVIDEHLDSLIDSANRAIKIIAYQNPSINHETYIKEADGIERYAAKGRIDHILLDDNGYEPYSDYIIENGKTIVFATKGVYEIYYEVSPTVITTSTADNVPLVLCDERYEVLIPLLAAYFVWLDDDETKAVMYYNTYLEQKNVIDSKIANSFTAYKAVIVGGFE